MNSVPGAPPSNVTIPGPNSTNQLYVNWNKIPDDEANGIITGRGFLASIPVVCNMKPKIQSER